MFTKFTEGRCGTAFSHSDYSRILLEVLSKHLYFFCRKQPCVCMIRHPTSVSEMSLWSQWLAFILKIEPLDYKRGVDCSRWLHGLKLQQSRAHTTSGMPTSSKFEMKKKNLELVQPKMGCYKKIHWRFCQLLKNTNPAQTFAMDKYFATL